jgi:predicted nucleotidyltransferase
MKTAGIVAEYNPLHAGHEYHIQKTRELTGADLIIVCMSGSYCERGIPAFFDKFTRTRDALAAGADIVLEMPLCASLGSAEIFARGGVSLLSAAGADLLSFGSECGNIDSLSALVEILLE